MTGFFPADCPPPGKAPYHPFQGYGRGCHENGSSHATGDLDGASVLHVADLITSASSYTRAWVPIISKLGAQMKQSLSVVDRLQGGAEALGRLKVESHALISVDKSVFEEAFRKQYIDEGQLKMVLDYMEDPDGSMRQFLKEHPTFVRCSEQRRKTRRAGKAPYRERVL